MTVPIGHASVATRPCPLIVWSRRNPSFCVLSFSITALTSFAESGISSASCETYVANDAEEIPDSAKEVSAVMLKLRTQNDGFLLDQTINGQGRVATLAWPIGTVMADLFDKMGWIYKVLTL